MSDNWLILAPLDPFAAPAADAAERARAMLADALPAADEVTVTRSETPVFVDAGANFSSVRCPGCGADAGSWWTGAMDHACRRAFRDLAVVPPCCGRATSLNDLDYDWPQGFARVTLEAMNPGVAVLDERVKREIDAQLGLETRVIWQHL